MKNVSTVKSETDSPKTPGGISKSLLTPCRRVGLSRNFRKSGGLPFKSPLPSKVEVEQEKVETRKRKESLEDTPETSENVDSGTLEVKNAQTPIRKAEEPRRKKSKLLINSINMNSDENIPVKVTETFNINGIKEPCENLLNELSSKCTDAKSTPELDLKRVATPLRLKSTSKIKKTSPVAGPKYVENTSTKKSPSNLTKECIVVIQKKILKKGKEKSPIPETSTQKTKEISQPAFNSDSVIPLISLNKETTNKSTDIYAISEDEDSVVSKTSKPFKSKSNQKTPTTAKPKSNSKVVEVEIHQVPDSDDDDNFNKKKTILIKKTYDKVTKPLKMKSTGSISQKDINSLNSRIEFKKKLLLARAASEDTKELMALIKKWHKGCQESLIQLMDLMKSKTDNQNMGYSEILQTLKIPSTLVGYDSENDCFLTPDDETILGSLI